MESNYKHKTALTIAGGVAAGVTLCCTLIGYAWGAYMTFGGRIKPTIKPAQPTVELTGLPTATPTNLEQITNTPTWTFTPSPTATPTFTPTTPATATQEPACYQYPLEIAGNRLMSAPDLYDAITTYLKDHKYKDFVIARATLDPNGTLDNSNRPKVVVDIQSTKPTTINGPIQQPLYTDSYPAFYVTQDEMKHYMSELGGETQRPDVLDAGHINKYYKDLISIIRAGYKNNPDGFSANQAYWQFSPAELSDLITGTPDSSKPAGNSLEDDFNLADKVYVTNNLGNYVIGIGDQVDLYVDQVTFQKVQQLLQITGCDN